MLYPVRIARTYPITQGSACRNSCKVSPGSSCRNNENPGGGQLPGIGGQSKMEWGVKGCRNSYIEGSDRKKALTPDEKRQAVAYLQEHRVSLRQACMLMKLSSSVYYYKHKINPDDAPIQDELTRLAEEHRRWGFWKMFH